MAVLQELIHEQLVFPAAGLPRELQGVMWDRWGDCDSLLASRDLRQATGCT